MKVLNLCDILDEIVIKNGFINQIMSSEYERIYIGSYFCSNYFTNIFYLNELAKCIGDRIPITLVIPVLNESRLFVGKKVIERYLDNKKLLFDEITVNDIGMYQYIKEKYPSMKCNLGRLFLKHPRDPRVSEYDSMTISIPFFDSMQEVFGSYNIVEIDATNESLLIKDDVRFGIHLPYFYITTGNICKFASINKDIKYKYRPNTLCNRECIMIYESYKSVYNGSNIEMFRIGRTVYGKRIIEPSINQIPERYIYFPFDELVVFKKELVNEGRYNEYFGTSK